ncbi:metallophosphoesterase, partial [Candidatus Woesearchaeota archaeon]|nr:metallophosphoesterase [Candidatus Woesearchaeota archaeon]
MLSEQIQTKKELVKYLFQKGILIEQSVLDNINENNIPAVAEFVENKKDGFIISSDDLKQIPELRKEGRVEKAESSVRSLVQEQKTKSRVIILNNYEDHFKKKDVQDFVDMFNKRFQALSNILKNRVDIKSPVSINKLMNKQSKEEVTIIGMVNEISETKNGHIMLKLEDMTGSINVLINKNRDELLQLAKELVPDVVVAINGTSGEKIIFANNLYIPDVPLNRELRKSPDEAYMAILSDLHIGSKQFMHEEFGKFIKWINGELGSKQQREIASKVKYIVIAGDTVEGVGIHPEQENDLEIKDVYDQYKKAAEMLAQIPKHIDIIIGPGNHDAMRIADPQPLLPKDYAAPLWLLPNATFITSPGMVNIHKSKNFPGFDLLVYHGFPVFY